MHVADEHALQNRESIVARRAVSANYYDPRHSAARANFTSGSTGPDIRNPLGANGLP